MDAQNRPTAAEMIKKVLEIREIIDNATKGFNELVRPYQEDKELLENLLMEEINRLGGQSIKTQFGTAIRSTVTSFRVADREAWMKFALKHTDMLTAHVAKEAVKEYVDKTRKLPPGLNQTTIYRTNVRSPSE